MHRVLLCLVSQAFLLSMASELVAAESNNVTPWRQDQPPNQPYSPQEAITHMSVPDGFSVELVAAEPDIVNPIALSFDDRGRIWITESVEYPRKPAGVGRDRVKILEDTDADGRADRVTVFAEGLNIPTGVAIGYGGVWVLNAPDLLFLRETNGHEASREVILTGFGRTDTHELPNSLTWGPDGWLYGLNGVFNQSRIRSINGQEYKFNCALWRVHPRTHEFQIVAEGTSNPFGLAWDTEGSTIVEACHWANDHLFHFVETGHYQRQAGTFPPFTIPIGSITDHGHQKTAYCGISYLDTDAYPVQFRERICVGNIHGGAINVDRLERDGSTYLAKAEPDLLNAHDAWFMPVALKIGPDGCLYILDWYDRYHCSQDAARDPEGVDRLKGRLYRLRYKDSPRTPMVDLARESDDQLVARLGSGNIYFRETAQQILTERLSERAPLSGAARQDLRAKLEQIVLIAVHSRKARLHALWTLVGSGPLEPAFHIQVLAHSDPAYRAWAVRAAGNLGRVSQPIREKIAALALDPTPDVQLQVAIASRKVDGLDALAILDEVLAHCGQDKILPSIVWNNLHPLLETNSGRFVSLISTKERWPPALAALAPRIVERILSAEHPDTTALAGFMTFAAERDNERAKDCFSEIGAKLSSLNESAVAQLKTELKPVLEKMLARASGSALFLSAQLLAAKLGLAEIDPAEIRTRLLEREQPDAVRLQALDALISFRDPTLLSALPKIFFSDTPSFIRRVLTILGRVEDPKLADALLSAYPNLAPELQPLAIDLLMQREPWARKVLDAVLANKLPRGALNANHLRKILESNDREALWAVEKAFGKIREERNPEREKVVAEMGTYLHEHIGDPHHGQSVFRQLCAQCHQLYGEGGQVGPDITANGRASFEQLLSNVFDPSLVIGPAYQVTTVVTKDGRNLTGLIAEDNEQRVVVRLPGEGQETVPRNNVKYTRVSKLSMMPEGIETFLDKKDLADLFAFLALDRPPTDPSAKVIPGAPAIFNTHASSQATEAVAASSNETSQTDQPICLHPDNSHYFLWRSQPRMLITAGEHYGAVMNLDFDYVLYLDELKANHFNLTRVFSGVYRELKSSFNITGNTLAPAPGRYLSPWARSTIPGAADGGNKFDLFAWDAAYFKRLKDFAAQAGHRGVVMELVLFCPMYDDSMWNVSPMNECNNVNGIGKLDRSQIYDAQNGNLLAVQKAVVAKLVTELNQFDNVYFEVCNEPYERGGLTKAWNDEIIATITDTEATLPRKHLIAQNFPPSSGAIADFNPRVSILNFHSPNAEAVRLNDALKRVVALDETGGADRSDTKYRTEAWVWVLAGGGVYDHLDFSYTTDRPDGTAVPLPPGTPGGGGPELRRQLRILKEFMEQFDFVRLKPDGTTARNNRITGTDGSVAESSVRVLSEVGQAYAVYIKGGTRAELILELPSASYQAEWIDTKTGQRAKTEAFIHGGGNKTMTSPQYTEDIALRVRRRNAP